MAGCTNVGHQEFRQVKVWCNGRLFYVSHMCGLKPPFDLYCNYLLCYCTSLLGLLPTSVVMGDTNCLGWHGVFL